MQAGLGWMWVAELAKLSGKEMVQRLVSGMLTDLGFVKDWGMMMESLKWKGMGWSMREEKVRMFCQSRIYVVLDQTGKAVAGQLYLLLHSGSRLLLGE